MPSPPPDPSPAVSHDQSHPLDSLYLTSELRSLRAALSILCRDPLRNHAKIMSLCSTIARLVVLQTRLLGKDQPDPAVVKRMAQDLAFSWFRTGVPTENERADTEPTTFEPVSDRWEMHHLPPTP